MKTKILLLTLALGASTCLLQAQDNNDPAAGQQPPGNEAGPGDPAGPLPRGGIHLLPPGATQRLNLTADQQTQLAALNADVIAKINALLTPEQQQQLSQMRPLRLGRGAGGPPPGRRGPGGPAGNGAGLRHPPAPLIAALDLNHDGVIDADEIAHASESLKALDRNGDGQITLDEILPPRPGGPGAPGAGPNGPGADPGNPGAPGGQARPPAPGADQ